VGKLAEPIRYLDQDEMDLIHSSALRILDEIGMRIDSHRALDYLVTAGCRVDHDTMVVRFPQEVVQGAVDRMRTAYADPERIPRKMAVRYSEIYFSTLPHRVHADFTANTGGFCVFIYDLEGRRRRATLEDVRESIRLADALDNVDLIGLPVSAQEIPYAMRPVIMAAELVKNTRKLGGIETFDALDAEYISRIGEVVAGSAEALRRNPILVGYAEARSPLCIDRNMAEILIAYVQRGLPQSLDTMPNGGATAPVTSAGTLAVGIAETLGGLVLATSVDPDAIVSVDVTPSLADMRTMLYPYAGVDRMPLLAAQVQMISEYYGCPGGAHGGKTDACYPGVQAGTEKVTSMLFPLLAGATGIGTMGHLENALTYSPQQLVIDNEIAGAVRRMLRGFEVTPETVALDVIKEVGIGGHYMGHLHTAEHFREETYLSDLYERLSWDNAWTQPVRGMEEKARVRARELMRQERAPVLGSEQARAIDEIIREAWARRRALGQA
jgi:trimethylamine--corrinoid protein Co-methyltransferase